MSSGVRRVAGHDPVTVHRPRREPNRCPLTCSARPDGPNHWAHLIPSPFTFWLFSFVLLMAHLRVINVLDVF